MTQVQSQFLHAVASEFKSRWEEDYDGEAYTVAEYLLEQGDITLTTSIDDATEAVSAHMCPPMF